MRLIASAEHTKDCGRRKHVDRRAARPRYTRLVALRRPAQERIAADGESCAVQCDEGAVRQAVDAAPVPTLGAAPQTLVVEHVIHFRGARTAAQTVCDAPKFGETIRILSPAFETGPVAGSERGRLIEKKQLSIVSSPYVAMPSFEREHAANPLPRSPAPRCERPRVGVKAPAAIAHESAARRVGKKLAERVDAILQRHCRLPAG